MHLDAHKDERQPESSLLKPDSEDLEKVFEYTNTILNVGNYIPPAMEEGLIGKLISITSEAALLDYEPAGGNLILNIDLDFWAPEMNYIDEAFSLKRTREWMEKADLITFATSPFFIKQERAIGVLRKLFED